MVYKSALTRALDNPLAHSLAGGFATAASFRVATGVRSPVVLTIAFMAGALTVASATGKQ